MQKENEGVYLNFPTSSTKKPDLLALRQITKQKNQQQ